MRRDDVPVAAGAGTTRRVAPVHGDDLLEPTLDRHRARPEDAPRVWRLGSQLYVAFFGGPLAAAAVGFLNGKRLGLPAGRLALIVAIGAVGLVAAGAVGASLGGDVSPRFLLIAAGVASYLGIRELQKHADRRLRAGRDEDEIYASLWIPGLLIVVVCGLASALLLAPVLR